MRPGEHVTPQVRLVRPIGAGGMGAVWLADHLALKTQVAVKFILAGRENDTEARERFSREAEAAAQVKSPHVAQIFDHGVAEDGVPFIVMELLEGEDLSRYVHAHGRLPLREAASIVTQMCRALARAHSKGLIHRDVKPANIFLCDVGTKERFVKLLDFGVAKVVGGDPSMATKSGAVTGTPVYMAPEQLLGARDLDHRADLWSVAVVAYEMISGHRPFEEETAAAIALRVHTRGMPRASEGMAGLSSVEADALDAFFERAWAIDPKKRIDSATALAEEFEAVVDILEPPGPGSGRRLTPIVNPRASYDRIELTLRDRPAPVSDQTLQSGRVELPPVPVQVSQPSASSSARVRVGAAPDAPKTETPISRHVRESTPAPTPAPPSRVRWLGVAAVTLVGVAIVVAFTIGRNTTDARTDAGSPSMATSSAAPPAPTPTPSAVASVAPSAAPPPLPPPSTSTSSAPTTTQAPTVKKHPVVAPSTTASTKPLEVIE